MDMVWYRPTDNQPEPSSPAVDMSPNSKNNAPQGSTEIEKEYEEVLRGIKGVKFIQKDRFNKDIGPYKEGTYDTLATVGKDLTLSLDIALQQYGEKLMQNKRGGIVALEPSSGEILALVSTPTYDPNMMVGRKRSKNSVLTKNTMVNLTTEGSE